MKHTISTIIYFLIISALNFFPLIMAFGIVGFNDTGAGFTFLESIWFAVMLTFLAIIYVSPLYLIGLFVGKFIKILHLKTYIYLAASIFMILIAWYLYVANFVY